jgi:hypothetical protein
VFKKIHFGCEIQLLFKEGITDEMIAEGKGKALYNANPFLPAKTKETFEHYTKRNLRELYQVLSSRMNALLVRSRIRRFLGDIRGEAPSIPLLPGFGCDDN